MLPINHKFLKFTLLKKPLNNFIPKISRDNISVSNTLLTNYSKKFTQVKRILTQIFHLFVIIFISIPCFILGTIFFLITLPFWRKANLNIPKEIKEYTHPSTDLIEPL